MDINLTDYFDTLASSWDSNPEKVTRAEVTAKKIKEVGFLSTKSLVDFGSGTGLLGVQLLDIFSKVTLVDSSRQMLDIAKDKIVAGNIPNIEIQCVQALSEVSAKHSAIATLMTLHHIDNIDQFFSQAFDKLEQDGILIIADLYKEDGSFHKHNPTYDGHNGFDINNLTTIAQNAEFDVLSVEKYFEIRQENFDGLKVSFPLFLFVAKKKIT